MCQRGDRDLTDRHTVAGGAYGPVQPIPLALRMCNPPVDVDHAVELPREFDEHGLTPPLKALAWGKLSLGLGSVPPASLSSCRLLHKRAADKLQASPHIFRYDKRFMKHLWFSLHVPTGGMV
jgi:hypothetical protein